MLIFIQIQIIYLSIFTNPFSPINKQVNNKISIFLLGSISPTFLGKFPSSPEYYGAA